MSGKPDKLQSHKKKTDKKSGESRKYAQIPCDSVSVIAEANGISALSEDIRKQLAEDVSYRLREVIHNCSVHLRQNKRRKLSAADVSAVFQTSDVPSIYGHLNQEPFSLLYIKEAGVFVPEEHDVDLTALALSSVTLIQKGEPFVKGKNSLEEPDASIYCVLEETTWEQMVSDIVTEDKDWGSVLNGTYPEDGEQQFHPKCWYLPHYMALHVDSHHCTWLPPDGATHVSGNTQSANVEDTKPATSNTDNINNNLQIPNHLLSYYSHISKIILGNSESLIKVVLKDLQTNSKIALIAPFLLNLLALGLQKLPRGAAYAYFRHRFLCTAEALTCNTFIEPSATISVHRLISTLLSCILDATLIEGTTARCNYELRSNAAQVLAKVVNRWCHTDTKLHLDILQKLGSVLLDGSNSLRNHYGVLTTVCALGYAALDYCLWPHLEQYLSFLDIMRVQLEIRKNKLVLPAASWLQQNADIMEIEGTILTAAEMLYRKHLNSLDQSPSSHSIMVLEKLLVAYFGDRLCARRLYYPVATTKQDSMETNTSNDGGMDVDMLVSSVRKDTGNSDFDLDYRNWTAVAKIPVHVPPLLVKSSTILSATLSGRRFNTLSSIRISGAFECPIKREQCPNTIHFNFAGANPVSQRRLKRRILDPRHAQFVSPSVYFSKSCQVGCIGKLVHRQHTITMSRSWLANILTTL